MMLWIVKIIAADGMVNSNINHSFFILLKFVYPTVGDQMKPSDCQRVGEWSELNQIKSWKRMRIKIDFSKIYRLNLYELE